jgi:hypothetical protein
MAHNASALVTISGCRCSLVNQSIRLLPRRKTAQRSDALAKAGIAFLAGLALLFVTVRLLM